MRPRELSRSVSLFAARTPTLAPATHTNSYALGAGDVVLVEPATPYEDEQAAWLAWARGLQAEGRRIVAVVATHHHLDHVGGLEKLLGALEVPFWAHAETASRVRHPAARLLGDGDVIELDGAGDSGAPIPERWRVLHTPGHAPGHVCLWNEAERTVVVGDMVASVGTILVDPVDGDMRAYLAQLDRLAGLGARLALPAHGEPIDEPTRLFRDYIAHRQKREAKIFAVLSGRRAPATARDLVPGAYDDVPATTWPIARLSVEAHLVKLVADGRARVESGSPREARYTALA